MKMIAVALETSVMLLTHPDLVPIIELDTTSKRRVQFSGEYVLTAWFSGPKTVYDSAGGLVFELSEYTVIERLTTDSIVFLMPAERDSDEPHLIIRTYGFDGTITNDVSLLPFLELLPTCFTLDGRLLIGGTTRGVRVYDTMSGALVREIVIDDSEGVFYPVTTIDVPAVNSDLVKITCRGRVYVLNLVDGSIIQLPNVQSKSTVFSNDGTRIAYAPDADHIEFVNARSGVHESTMEFAKRGTIGNRIVAFDSTYVVVRTSDRSISVMNTVTGEIEYEYGFTETIRSAAVSDTSPLNILL